MLSVFSAPPLSELQRPGSTKHSALESEHRPAARDPGNLFSLPRPLGSEALESQLPCVYHENPALTTQEIPFIPGFGLWEQGDFVHLAFLGRGIGWGAEIQGLEPFQHVEATPWAFNPP